MTQVVDPAERVMDDFEIALLDADSSFCHLKFPDGRFCCGQGFGQQHYRVSGAWRKTGCCDGCGKPICPDCLATAL